MTRFEEFKAQFKENPQAFREKLKGSGSFDFSECFDSLSRLERKLNGRLLIYLFGDVLARHYAEKFSQHRNIIKLMSDMGSEERMFILHELKTNMFLFTHC